MKIKSRFKLILVGVYISLLPAISCATTLKEISNPNSAIVKELYNPAGNVIQGNPNGDVTITDFFDYNCFYCRKLSPLLIHLSQKNAHIRIVYKEFLLFGKISELPSYAALAANKQGKYMAMHLAMLTDKKKLDLSELIALATKLNLNIAQFKTDLNDPAIHAQIAENTAFANKLGVEGAPTLFATNSKILKDPAVISDTKQYLLVGNINQKVLNNLVKKVEAT